jgi:hypothetical protein
MNIMHISDELKKYSWSRKWILLQTNPQEVRFWIMFRERTVQ